MIMVEISSETEMLDFGEEFAQRLWRWWRQGPHAVAKVLTDAVAETVAAETLTNASMRTAAAATTNASADAPTDAVATLIELVGDVGTGKTTFTRGLAAGLGVKETVTSPSFTISKVYAMPDGKTLVHYDFYRLPDPGLMADDLAEVLRDPDNLVVVEWADSVRSFLPKRRITITFSYTDAARLLEVRLPAEMEAGR